MRAKKMFSGLFVIAMLSAGCAYIDQNLKVNPELSVNASSIGQGKQVALRIVDDRDDQVIGKRRDGYGFNAAKITTDQDLVEVLKSAIAQGLKDQGFEVVGPNDSPIALRVDLRALSYDTAMGLWTGGNIGKSTLKVIATQASGKTYEKSYHGQREIRTAFVASQETNTKVINEALTETLNKVFADKELWDFLVQ